MVLREKHVRVLFGLERDPDQRHSARERRLHTSLAAGGDREIDPRHDPVAGQQRLDDHIVAFEVAQIVPGRGDDDPRTERAQGCNDCPHKRLWARGDSDIYDRAAGVEDLLDPLGDRRVEMREDRSHVPHASPCAVGGGAAGPPLVDILARQPKHLGHVGDKREIAEQERREARYALDAKLARDTVKAARPEIQPRHPGVVHPPPQTGRQPANRTRERDRRRDGQQVALEHWRHVRARVLGHQLDPGKPGRQQRRERPAGDCDADVVRAKVVGLECRVAPQLLIAPHALVRGPDPRNGSDKGLAAHRAPARPENVTRNAGLTQDAFPGAAMRRDSHGHPSRRKRAVDLEHPRGL